MKYAFMTFSCPELNLDEALVFLFVPLREGILEGPANELVVGCDHDEFSGLRFGGDVDRRRFGTAGDDEQRPDDYRDSAQTSGGTPDCLIR